MATLLSSSDVAAALSMRRGKAISVRSVQRAAARAAIGQRVGRDLVFLAGDIDRLDAAIPGVVGNPNKFPPGNDLWTLRKKGEK